MVDMQLGGLAHMVERPLSMREAPGSIPGSSILFIIILIMDKQKQTIAINISTYTTCTVLILLYLYALVRVVKT